MSTPIGPGTVDLLGASWPFSATRWCFQRKTFFANGRHWAFYIGTAILDGVQFVYNSSVDGLTWGVPTIIRGGTTGEELSVCLEEFTEGVDPSAYYVHYAYSAIGGGDLVYRRGELNADGSITWSAEQIVLPEEPGEVYYRPTICIDNNALPYIGYCFSLDNLPYVIASTTAPIWTTKAGFPYPVYALPADWVCIVVPFGTEIHVTFAEPFGPILYDVYDPVGDGWLGTTPSLGFIGPDNMRISVTSHDQVNGWQGTGYDPTVHVTFQDPMNDLFHQAYDTANGPMPPNLVWIGPDDMWPAISIRRYGSDNPAPTDYPRELFIYFASPWMGWILYLKSGDGGLSWTDESAVWIPEFWMEETQGPMPSADVITSYFDEGREYTGQDAGYLGCLWNYLVPSPDVVRYGAMEFADPSEDLGAGFIVRHLDGTEDLLAGFNAQHIGGVEDLPAGFEVGQGSADLLGEMIVRPASTLNLHGQLTIRDSGDTTLSAGFIIRHPGTVDLLGGFDSGQNEANLSGQFEVGQGSVNLKGGFDGQVPLNLNANFEIRRAGSAELLGEFVSRQAGDRSLPAGFDGQVVRDLNANFEIRRDGSGELLGEMIVRNVGAANLPAGFMIRQGIVELSGEMIVRHPGSAELLGEMIVRGAGSQNLLAGFDVGGRSELLPQWTTWEEYLEWQQLEALEGLGAYEHGDYAEVAVTAVQGNYRVGTNLGTLFTAAEVLYLADRDVYVRYDNPAGVQKLIRAGDYIRLREGVQRIYYVRVAADGTLRIWPEGTETP